MELVQQSKETQELHFLRDSQAEMRMKMNMCQAVCHRQERLQLDQVQVSTHIATTK